MNHEFDPRDINLNHHQLQDALRMAYSPHHCVLQQMMTYYVETPEMGVSILSDGVNKPFSVRPVTDDDLLYRNA